MWNTRLSELEFDGDELAASLSAIESGWITAGGRTEAFEEAFARVGGTSHAVAVSSGTAALMLALKAVGIGPGDEVLCPSLTFAATAAAIIHCGATPVFVDIASLADPTMDPVDAARKLTRKTRAILPVHYAGIPCQMDPLETMARDHNIDIVEDAAHAPGASYRGRRAGSLGTAGCFSLFGNKNITTAEGGVVTTHDPELAEKVRLLRSHGMTSSSWDKGNGRHPRYDVVEIGFNYRFDDIRASIGLAQLRKLDNINRRRRNLVSCYNARIQTELPDLLLPLAAVTPERNPSYHIYPILLANGDERDRMESRLGDAGIQTSIHYRPVHQLTAFRRLFPNVRLPKTETYGARELTLPLYPSMPPSQVDTIVDSMVHSYTHI